MESRRLYRSAMTPLGTCAMKHTASRTVPARRKPLERAQADDLNLIDEVERPRDRAGESAHAVDCEEQGIRAHDGMPPRDSKKESGDRRRRCLYGKDGASARDSQGAAHHDTPPGQAGNRGCGGDWQRVAFRECGRVHVKGTCGGPPRRMLSFDGQSKSAS